MSRPPPCRKTLLQTEEILGWRAGYIERCKSGSEGGTRHTYWVNGPYPTECRVGGWPGSFCTTCGRDGPAGATFAWHAQASVWLQAWAAGAIPYLVTTC